MLVFLCHRQPVQFSFAFLFLFVFIFILFTVYNIAKEEFPFTKFKSQIIMTENNFRYHIVINYDTSSSACIDLFHVVAKKSINTIIIFSKRVTIGKNEPRALIWHYQAM